jgi:predicted regulator of Ras-like GTPase activity (Roadblock/LC7/MglB family)
MSAPGSRRPRAAAPPRDQATSTFTRILERLVGSTPGAKAAALVDFEGETVDYAGDLDTFELKVAAAHWQLVLAGLGEEAKACGDVRQVTVRTKTRAYVVRRVDASYAVVVVLHRRAAFAVSERALQEADSRLTAEAGWSSPHDAPRWYCVEVETERADRTRPVRLRVADGWQPIEVMGAVVGLKPREKGFRVRLPSGAEMMLVRERLGRWFADEPMDE